MGVYNPMTNLFEASDQRNLVSKLGDPLEKLDKFVNWERFRDLLEEVFPTARTGKGGRPRMDPVKMFKVLVLQRMYNLSDHAVEFQIADRLSFQRFIGIRSIKEVPDEKTVWLFREQANNAGLVDRLFDEFIAHLHSQGLIAHEGKIVDASIVEVPRQRNTREENKKIKAGEEVKEWEALPHKKRQKDVDARWTKKHGHNYFGYKNHIKVDARSKLIEDYDIGAASEHDSQVIASLIDPDNEKGQAYWADSAYRSDDIECILSAAEITSKIHEKGTRNKPLSKAARKRNNKKSQVRCRVEHVFGYMHTSMGGTGIRTIGLDRAACQVGLTNLVYNINRAVFLIKNQWRGVSIAQL